jgi:hypothetical protein
MSFHQVTYYQIRCDDCDRLWGSEGSRWRTKEIVEHWFRDARKNGAGSWTERDGKHFCGLSDCEKRKQRKDAV